MNFIVRLLFSGLIAFIPSEDGQELTILLLNVDHAYHTSDGTSLAHHEPLLLTRAGTCTGQCPQRDADIAQIIFSDKSTSAAQDSLEVAVAGGGAWRLAGSDLSLNADDLPPLTLREGLRASTNGVLSSIPTTATERGDFSWLADLKQVCPTGCTVDQSILGTEPPSGLIAARFKLRSGNVFTYATTRIGSDVTPVHFKRLDGQGSTSPYSQAVASWIAADIEVSGENIEIVESTFAGAAGRSMTLTPDENGRVEVAVLNLPPFVPPPASTTSPEVGKHFERYYDLSETPASQSARLVPYAGAAAGSPSYPEVDWSSIHPQEELWSDLLNLIRLNIGRTAYDQAICPPVKNPLP